MGEALGRVPLGVQGPGRGVPGACPGWLAVTPGPSRVPQEMAAFMACGHAKFTGEVAVCMATSGPGAIHLLNGLYDA